MEKSWSQPLLARESMSGHLLASQGLSLSSFVLQLHFPPKPLSFYHLIPKETFSTESSELNARGLLGEDTSLGPCIFLSFRICDLDTASWSFIPLHLWGNKVGTGNGTKGKSESAQEYLESSAIDSLYTIRFEIGRCKKKIIYKIV